MELGQRPQLLREPHGRRPRSRRASLDPAFLEHELIQENDPDRHGHERGRRPRGDDAI